MLNLSSLKVLLSRMFKKRNKKTPSNEGEGWGDPLAASCHPCASVGILGFVISIFKR